MAPTTKIPTDEEFYSKKKPGYPDIEFLKQHFIREGRLTEDQAAFILTKTAEVFKKEPNVLDVDAPITGMFEECSNVSDRSTILLIDIYFAWTDPVVNSPSTD